MIGPKPFWAPIQLFSAITSSPDLRLSRSKPSISPSTSFDATHVTSDAQYPSTLFDIFNRPLRLLEARRGRSDASTLDFRPSPTFGGQWCHSTPLVQCMYRFVPHRHVRSFPIRYRASRRAFEAGYRSEVYRMFLFVSVFGMTSLYRWPQYVPLGEADSCRTMQSHSY